MGSAREDSLILYKRSVCCCTTTVVFWNYDSICKSLSLRDPILIRQRPNRVNLMYSVLPRPDDGEWQRQILLPLIKRLSTQGQSAPRTVIVCNDAQLKKHSEAYEYMLAELGRQAYTADGKRMVEMYHKDSSDKKKKEIEASLRDSSGHVRIVIVSSALGRGANFPAIPEVIFLQPPLSLEELYQAAGRAGRDTKAMAQITVYFQGADIPKNRASRSLIAWIRCKTDHCRRKVGLDYFAFPGDPSAAPGNHHTCCDLCVPRCSCEECKSRRSRKRPSPVSSAPSSPFSSPSVLSQASSPSSPKAAKRVAKVVTSPVLPSSPFEAQFRSSLHTYFPLTLTQFCVVATGVTRDIIEQLVTRHSEITSVFALPVRFGLLHKDARLVWTIFSALKKKYGV